MLIIESENNCNQSTSLVSPCRPHPEDHLKSPCRSLAVAPRWTQRSADSHGHRRGRTHSLAHSAVCILCLFTQRILMEMLAFSFGAFLARSVEEFARVLGTRGSTSRGGTIHRGNSVQCIRKRTFTNSV